jgi:hypothetical protein
MYQINEFKSSKEPKVVNTTGVIQILNRIKKSGQTTSEIIKVRELGKANPNYQVEKTNLPTVRFNFLFDKKANNNNIIKSTGLIYIDVDDCEVIDLSNQLIYAAWKSVSNCGYGILVKVDGLTLDNFSSTYISIANQLGLNADKGAKKATQQTILSYDPELYYNPNSIIFEAINEKVSSSSIQKEERLIGVDDTFSDKLRFNNINDYFTGENEDKDYIVFEGDKQTIIAPYLPYRIQEGKRNITLYFHLTQYAQLNPSIGSGVMIKLAEKIVSHFEGEEYSEGKIRSIVNSVLTKRENGELELFYNQERRILFNPNKQITKLQKQKIVGQIMGQMKREKTSQEIYDVIENWNFNLDGKITQQGIAEKSEKGIATIKRYWSEFKDYVKMQNKAIKETFEPEVIADIQVEEKVSEIASNEEKIYIYNYIIENYNYDADLIVDLISYAIKKMDKSYIDNDEINKLKIIINDFIKEVA